MWMCKELCFGKYHTIIRPFYIHTGEKGGLLSIRLREQKYNLKEGLFSKSILTLHAFEEWHMTD
jgi:hypothetical protein